MRQELDWVAPATGMTVLLFALARPESVPFLGSIALWTMIMALVCAIAAGGYVVALMVQREAEPFRRIGDLARNRGAAFLVGITLAGANLALFMQEKVRLNEQVAFWAGPWLARIDRALFLGHRPDKLLAFLSTDDMALFYHRGWFFLIGAALVFTLFRPPSRDRSAILLTWFGLWTVIGPAVHTLLPAGGPLFFGPLGFGNTYADLRTAPETGKLADYLWRLYQARSFAPGAGISAMPSLHIATTVWAVIALRGWARIAAGVAGALIFALSIALGWHFAIDGIVGGALAFATYRLFLALLLRQGDLGEAVPARIRVEAGRAD